MVDVSPSVLSQLLSYDEKSGRLVWRERDISFFSDGKITSAHAQKVWNSKYANSDAFKSINKDGYHFGAIFKKQYRAHRVIWAMVYGEWPVKQIDHINGERSDNRIVNLRAVSLSENLKNQKRREANTSGANGVYKNKKTGRWYAQVKVAGKGIHLGCFVDFLSAVDARKNADVKYGFHRNHGRP